MTHDLHALQYDIVWQDKAANHAIVERMLGDLQPKPGALVALPEMFDTGFCIEPMKTSDDLDGGLSESWCQSTAKRFGIYLLGASIRQPDGPTGQATNNAIVFNPDGELVCRYEKIFTFSADGESETFRNGTSIQTFDWNGITVCPLICYDLRFPELWRLAVVDHGAEILIDGANWPAPRTHHWTTLLIARAIENLAIVVGVNRSGKDPNHSFSGASRIVNEQGITLAEADESDDVVLSTQVDIESLRDWRKNFCALHDTQRNLLGQLPF